MAKSNEINIGMNYSEVAKGFQEIIDKANEAKQALDNLRKSGTASAQDIANAEQNLVNAMETLRDATTQTINEGKQQELTYSQISQAMSLMIQYSKSMSAEMKNSEQWTKPVNGLNNALKQSDALMGNYQRRVGAYSSELERNFKQTEAEMKKQGNSLRMSITQVIRELPSLSISPEMFMLAISNNIPQVIEAFSRYKESVEDTKKAEEAFSTSTNINTKEQVVNTSAVKANTSEQVEQTDTNLTAAESETELTAKIAACDTQININTKSLELLTAAEARFVSGSFSSAQAMSRLAEQLGMSYGQFMAEYNVVNENGVWVIKNAEDREKLIAAIKAQKTNLTELIAIQEKEKISLQEQKDGLNDVNKSAAGASGGLKAFGKAIGSILNWQTLLIIGMTLLISYGKQIREFFSDLMGVNIDTSFAKNSKSLKEWQKDLKEAGEGSASAIAKLQAYAAWWKRYDREAKSAKTESERAKAIKEEGIAMKETIKLAKEQGVTLDENSLKNGELAGKIDEVTAALWKQAAAQGMMDKVAEKYKEVIDAWSDYAARKANGVTGGDEFWSSFSNTMGAFGGFGTKNATTYTYTSPEDWYNNAVNEAEQKAMTMEEQFEAWLKMFTEKFDASDLFNADKGKDGKKADFWYSKWEAAIKQRETEYQESIVKLDGMEDDSLKFIDKEWWKYTNQGQTYYENMFNEYEEHYRKIYADQPVQLEKSLKDMKQKRTQYETDMALYIQNLEKQYTHPDWDSDYRAVEEWYETEKQKYEQLGILAEHSEELDEEHRRRLYDVAKKYRDEYQFNGIFYGDEWRDVAERDELMALAEAQQWYEDQVEEYTRAGKDLTNLNLEYTKKQEQIRDEFRETELNKQLDFLEKEKELAEAEANVVYGRQVNYLANDTTTSPYLNSRGKEYQNKTRQGAAINGGHNGGNFWENLDYNQRMSDMQKLTDEYARNTDLIKNQIETLEAVQYESADKEEERQLQISELKHNLALTDAEYQMELDQMVHDNAVELWDERTNAAKTTFQVMGELMTNISSLCEEGTEEYKGFAAAGAAMSAIASSVDAYKSVVGIPYVGPFLAPIAAASALLAGAAQIKQIYAVDSDGSNASSVASSNAYVGAMPSEITSAIPSVNNVTGLSEQTNLNSESQNIRCYVVDKDLSNGVSSYKTKVSNTSF